MSERLISVIVPVYNTEAYLEKCLDSLVAQTYPNWEAILVDDGSTDRSGEICDEYANNYPPRFRVIHQENKGVSSARNCALAASSGEYVTFLDSDDWLENNALEVIVRDFERYQVDAVVTGYISDHPNKSIRQPSRTAFVGVCDQKELVRQLNLIKDSYWGNLCNKSMKRSCIFQEHSEPVWFPEDVAFAEDQLWLLYVYKNIHTACFDPIGIYHYVIRPGSAVRSLEQNREKILEAFHTYEEICRISIEVYGIDPEMAKARLAYQVFTHRLQKIYEANFKDVNRYLLDRSQPYVDAMMASPDFTEKQKRQTRTYLRLMKTGIPPRAWNTFQNIRKRMKRVCKKVISKARVKLMRYIPLSRTIVFESFPPYTDNTYWFAKYLAEHTDIFKAYKMAWHIPKKADGIDSLFGIPCLNLARDEKGWRRIFRYYYLTSAKLIVDCNWPCRKRQDRQIRIHLGHGAPIKAVETYGHSIGKKDLLIVPSEYWREWFAEEMDQPLETTLPLGYPRNDILCTLDYPRIEELKDKKAVIWMPAFRQHSRDRRKAFQMTQILPMGFPILHSQEDVDVLDDWLGKWNMVLLLRLHPSQDARTILPEARKNIWIADDAFLRTHDLQLYELLAMTDGLITDYSSVYYDYLLTGKPIALTPEDLDLYRESFHLVVDYEKDLNAYRVLNMEQLKVFLQNIANDDDPEKECRTRKCTIYNANQNGTSSQAIYEEIRSRFDI